MARAIRGTYNQCTNNVDRDAVATCFTDKHGEYPWQNGPDQE
jgi:hypothetical protein